MSSFPSPISSVGKGFTLIEVLVVIAIMGVVSGFLISGVNRSRADLAQTASRLVADLREAQTRANTGTVLTDTTARVPGASYRCGYGMHANGTGGYIVYAGPDAEAVACNTADRNYQAGGSFATGDVVVRTVTPDNPNVIVESAWPDIFFEPPNFKTYINNSADPNAPMAQIVVRIKNGQCPADCRTINVSTSGKIELQ